MNKTGIKIGSLLFIIGATIAVGFTACKKTNPTILPVVVSKTSIGGIAQVFDESDGKPWISCPAPGSHCIDYAMNEADYNAFKVGTGEAKTRVWVNDLGNGESELVYYIADYAITPAKYKQVVLDKTLILTNDDSLSNHQIVQDAFKAGKITFPCQKGCKCCHNKGSYPVTFIGTLGQTNYQVLFKHKFLKDGLGDFKLTTETIVSDVIK
jgi:hypothetical protein